MYFFCKWTRVTLNWYMGVWFFFLCGRYFLMDDIYGKFIFWLWEFFLKDYKIPIRLTSLDHCFISQLLHDNGWFLCIYPWTFLKYGDAACNFTSNTACSKKNSYSVSLYKECWRWYLNFRLWEQIRWAMRQVITL